MPISPPDHELAVPAVLAELGFSRSGPVNPADFDRRVSFKKHEYIFKPGAVCNEMFFMERGLARCFYLHGDKEVNLRLMCDRSGVLAYSSFITQQPSNEYVQCLQDCEGYILSMERYGRDRHDNPETERFFRFLAEEHYLSLERRLMTLQSKSADERYAFFCHVMEKKIVCETPSQHIASYLGIAPESFSRLKRRT